MKNGVTILLTGCGSPGAHGIIGSLAREPALRAKIIGVDENERAIGANFVDRFLSVPVASDEAYIREMLQLCKRESVDVVLPMATRELLPLAQAKSEFLKVGTIVGVSEPASLVAANHKGALLTRLAHHDIPVPNYRTVHRKGDLLEAIANLGHPLRPVCFKPVYGSGSRGFRVLDASVDRVKHLFESKPSSVHMSLQELKFLLEGAEEIPELLVMEYLPGEEYSVDILADNGRVLVAIPRLRERMLDGITTEGTVQFAPEVTDYAAEVVRALGLHGNVGVQVRRNAKGEPRILELNPRLQATTVHALAAGVNLPYLGIKLHLGQPIFASELEVRFGTRMMRYWKEVYFDVRGTPFRL